MSRAQSNCCLCLKDPAVGKTWWCGGRVPVCGRCVIQTKIVGDDSRWREGDRRRLQKRVEARSKRSTMAPRKKQPKLKISARCGSCRRRFRLSTTLFLRLTEDAPHVYDCQECRDDDPGEEPLEYTDGGTPLFAEDFA